MAEDIKAYRDTHTIMMENSERFGAKNFVVSVDQGKQLTFSQINHICNKVANFLRERGVKKDDRVTLIGENGLETIVIFFGVLKYGAIISPINVEESEENIHRIVDRVMPRFIIYDEELNFDLKKNVLFVDSLFRTRCRGTNRGQFFLPNHGL